MSIIVNENSIIAVQGITGKEGSFHTQAMLNYGTKVVAGVTPGKGGQELCGVPVYNTPSEAVAKHGVNTSIIFVPAQFTKTAVLDAINAGIKVITVITEHVPVRDSIEFISLARKMGCTIIGPNCPGIMNPQEKIRLGIMPSQIFAPGSIGVISRSGTLTYEIVWAITKYSMGQSTCIGIGGDPIVGLTYIDVLKMFADDSDTKAVVLIGEIGGNAEELAAEYIKQANYPKPVVAYIAGKMAPPEKTMGHAGAIIMGDSGSADSKIEAFSAARVPVAERPSDVTRLLKQAL